MSIQKKKRKNYSNKEVKTRNLLTNVSYRRFKQSDFKKDSFVIDILSFLLQNFTALKGHICPVSQIASHMQVNPSIHKGSLFISCSTTGNSLG